MGVITKPHTNKRIVERASKKLASTRDQLKRLLETSPLSRDPDGYIRDSIQDKILQLITTDLPAPYPATWDDARQMRRRLNPRHYSTNLDEMDRMWSEQELDEEFGLLPGDEVERDEALDGDWEMEMEVGDRLIAEGRCLRDLVGAMLMASGGN